MEPSPSSVVGSSDITNIYGVYECLRLRYSYLGKADMHFSSIDAFAMHFVTPGCVIRVGMKRNVTTLQ